MMKSKLPRKEGCAPWIADGVDAQMVGSEGSIDAPDSRISKLTQASQQREIVRQGGLPPLNLVGFKPVIITNTSSFQPCFNRVSTMFQPDS